MTYNKLKYFLAETAILGSVALMSVVSFLCSFTL